MRAEEIIKAIKDNNLEKGFFHGEEFEAYDESYSDDFDTLNEFLESLNIPTEFTKVDSREDTSEFWSIIHFTVEDIYIKISGRFDSYMDYNHYYNKVTQVFPKQITKTIYE